ncbi:MAG: hypothetical protein WD176_07845, partial [Pirellulales bacterium]
EKPQSVRHSVHDLTSGNAKKLADLLNLIRSTAAPGTWRAADAGRIEVVEHDLTIQHTYRGQQAVATLLAKLRAARAENILAAGADRSALTTRYAQARPNLAKTVTLVFSIPTPLTTILRRLEQETQTVILVDWHALALEGVGDATEATLVATAQPLEQALAALVEPLDLACRVVNQRTLVITTPEQLEEDLELEVYPLGDLASSADTAESLIAGLKKQLGEDRFHEGGRAVLHYDAQSRALVVLDNQNGQISLEKALTAERARLGQKNP